MNMTKIPPSSISRFITLLFTLAITLMAFTTNVFANRHDRDQILDEVQYQVDSHNWAEAKEIIDFFQNSI